MSNHSTRSIERWNEMFERLVLVQYKKLKHGEEAPQEGGQTDKEEVSSSFGFWLDTQKNFWQHHKVGSDDVLDERYQRLAGLGGLGEFETVTKKGISSQEERWNDMCETLLDYKEKHGHVKVPQNCNENPKFGRWVSRWKSQYREYKRTNGQKGDPEQMKRLESIGLVDDILTGNEQRRVKSNWNDMYKQLLDFKQKHGHVKVPVRYKENPKLGTWVSHWRSKYRAYKRTNGQKGDPERMKRLESIGLVDDVIFRKKEDKKTKCADNKVLAPIVVSSMSLTFPSNTQTVTKEMPSSTGMKRKKNDEKADLDFLGSELRGKGGFWI